MRQGAGDGKRVWLFLLREWGRFDTAAVAAGTGLDKISANGALHGLAKGGFCIKYAKTIGGRVLWSLAPNSKVPNGVTVQDFIDADVLKFLRELQAAEPSRET